MRYIDQLYYLYYSVINVTSLTKTLSLITILFNYENKEITYSIENRNKDSKLG